MKQEEAAAALEATNQTLIQVGTETDTLLQKIAELEQALADAIASGNQVTPELQAAVEAVSAQAHAVDDKVPDAPPPGKK